MPLLDALQCAPVPRVAARWAAAIASPTCADRSRRFRIDWAALDRRRKAELAKLDAMQQYAYTKGCRRGFVLRYFGDPAAGKDRAAAATTASARTIASTPAAGADAARKREAWRAKRRGDSVARPSGASRRGVLGDVERGRRSRCSRGCASCAARIAREEQVPAYVVFPDRTLVEMAVRRPESLVRARRDSRRGTGEDRASTASDSSSVVRDVRRNRSRLTDPWTTSLYFSEQHLAMREMVRQFARDEVAPVAAQATTPTPRSPGRTCSKMGELGLLGVPWPEELGGAGLDLLSYMIVIHELAKVDASHGTHDLRAHHARHVADRATSAPTSSASATCRCSRPAGCSAASGSPSRSAGSDAGGTRTTAVRRGDHYVLNGTKRFITHGGVGEIFVVTAVTDPSKGTQGDQLLHPHQGDDGSREGARDRHRPRAVARRRCPGFRAGKKEDKLGWRASDTRELIMEDVEVPVENLLGEEGQGFVNFMQTLDSGRIGIAALSLGIAEGAFEQALQYASVAQAVRPGDRRAFRASQFQLSDMATEIEAGKHLMYHAAWLAQNGSRSARKRRWRSSSAPSSPCARRSRRCRSTAATATPRTIRSSA